jgi:hypothetical protein
MEEHFLKDFVSDEVKSRPEPWYNSAGDCIIYQTTDEATVAERVDELLTIYRSLETGKAIGYQIKGVLAIIKIFGLDGIQVDCVEDGQELKYVSMFALLLAAYERGPKTIGRRRAYAHAFESSSRHPTLQIQELDFAQN